MDRKVIPRSHEDDALDAAPVWILSDCAWRDDGKQTVHWRCPACKKIYSLGLHSIDPNGEVNASVLCLCGNYHEFVTFADWPTDLKKLAGERFVESI